jgi:hypothetical protein
MEDTMDVVARRTVPPRSISSEVAAVSLGMRHAMRVVPPYLRRRVLILSDSESALEFYCGEGGGGGDVDRGGAGACGDGDDERRWGQRTRTRTRSKTKAERLREEAHRRCLLLLTNETPNGVLFSRVRSSSRGVGIAIGIDHRIVAASESAEDAPPPRDGIGFIDHDIADHLSSIVRSVPNVEDDYGVEIGGGGGLVKLNILSHAVQPLGVEDIAWLENSDTIVGNGGRSISSANVDAKDSLSAGRTDDRFWRSIEVVGSEMRSDRRERNLRRIEIIEKLLGLYAKREETT